MGDDKTMVPPVPDVATLCIDVYRWLSRTVEVMDDAMASSLLATLRGRLVIPEQRLGFVHRGDAYRAVVVSLHDVHWEDVPSGGYVRDLTRVVAASAADVNDEAGRIARACIGNKRVAMADRTSTGAIVVAHHQGAGNFRCHVARDEAALAALMVDLYASIDFEPPLEPPYAEADLARFEARAETQLPPLLRHYLLHVSREFSCDGCRSTLDLEEDDGVMEPNAAVTEDALLRGCIFEDDEGSCDETAGTLYLSTNERGMCSLVVVKGEGCGTVMEYDGDATYDLEPLWKRLMEPRPDACRMPC
jgi:hypothetical protein